MASAKVFITIQAASEVSFCKFSKITLGSERTHLGSLEADSEMEVDMQNLYQYRNRGEESRLGQRETCSNEAGLTKPQPTVQRGWGPINAVPCWAQVQGL